MIKIQKILVPIDFSENSLKAACYGLEIGRERNARVVFLHVIHQRAIDAIQDFNTKLYKGDFLQVMRKMVSERRIELEQFVPVEWLKGHDAEFLIRKGKPADEIREFAREQMFDLVILGTHGRSAVSKTLLGSIARNVAEHAPCPVLLVRDKEHEFVE